jgi:hypothetical protein
MIVWDVKIPQCILNPHWRTSMNPELASQLGVKDKLLLRAREILKDELEEIGGCDHSVGICCCKIKELLEDIDENLDYIPGKFSEQIKEWADIRLEFTINDIEETLKVTPSDNPKIHQYKNELYFCRAELARRAKPGQYELRLGEFS